MGEFSPVAARRGARREDRLRGAVPASSCCPAVGSAAWDALYVSDTEWGRPSPRPLDSGSPGRGWGWWLRLGAAPCRVQRGGRWVLGEGDQTTLSRLRAPPPPPAASGPSAPLGSAAIRSRCALALLCSPRLDSMLILGLTARQ